MADNVFNADGQYLVRVRDDLTAREELTARISGLIFYIFVQIVEVLQPDKL